MAYFFIFFIVYLFYFFFFARLLAGWPCSSSYLLLWPGWLFIYLMASSNSLTISAGCWLFKMSVISFKSHRKTFVSCSSLLINGFFAYSGFCSICSHLFSSLLVS
jgi:hypothetical protein